MGLLEVHCIKRVGRRGWWVGKCYGKGREVPGHESDCAEQRKNNVVKSVHVEEVTARKPVYEDEM